MLLLCALVCALQDPDAKAAATIDELRADDIAVRRKAIEALIELGKTAVPAILRTLADESPGLPQRVEDLVKKLAAKEWKERDEAMRSLARLGRRAIEFIKKHTDDGDPEVRWRVKTSLAEIEEMKGRESTLDFTRNAALCQVLGQIGDGRAVKPLLKEMLGSGSPDVRLRAGEALGLLRASLSSADADEACDEAIRLLSASKDRRERALLVKTMGLLRSKAAVRPLTGLVDDKAERDVHLKRNAMAALAIIGEADGLAAVVRSLDSDDVYLREAAYEILKPLAGDGGFDPRLDAKANAEAIKKCRAWWSKKSGKDWQE